MASEKKPAKSTFIVRTDAVTASSGKAHFYGEKVKLSEEEARPLLRGRKGEHGVSLRNRRHVDRMWGRWGRKTMPDEVNPALWRSVVPGYPTLPITELHRDGRPTHWDTPEYRQDVPKR